MSKEEKEIHGFHESNKKVTAIRMQITSLYSPAMFLFLGSNSTVAEVDTDHAARTFMITIACDLAVNLEGIAESYRILFKSANEWSVLGHVMELRSELKSGRSRGLN